MGLPVHMNVSEWKRGLRCRTALWAEGGMIVGCQDGQHVPVEFSTESSVGGFAKNNTSGKGQWRFQPGQETEE